MAKKQEGVNKTKVVLEYWKAHRTASASEIAKALNEQGIAITAGYVANIKSKSKKHRRAVKKAVKTVQEKGGVGVPEIKAALALLKACETAVRAKEALAAAQEIKASM